MFRIFALFFLVSGCVFYWITAPDVSDRNLPTAADAQAGETVFYAAGCASCHTAPNSDNTLALTGGQSFVTQFGTFYAPNVSTDPVVGIGQWSVSDFERAVRRGVSPEGKHYYPAFPYTSYQNMTDQDVADLWAFWQTLPAHGEASKPHDIMLPVQWRRPLGGWKTLFMSPDWVEESGAEPRGRYLVEALGHCGECHTPRGPLGNATRSKWLSGAPNPSGQGRIPGIISAQLDWSVEDIAEYLKSGMTPDYDFVGGHMADVVANTARLTDQDRLAIARYLKLF